MSETPMTPEQRAAIAALIGDAKPATAGLLVSFAESVRDRREHEHPKWEDFYCLNLSSYMGERMAPVLRRLLDAEARVAELEAAQESPLAFAEKLDAKSLDNFLIALGTATEYEPLDGAIAQIHELIRSYREGKPAEEDCDHPNGHGPYGCAGCGAFAPADNEDGGR